MAGTVGDRGYYINRIYGPFKTKGAAEFFNFIAFGSPRSMNAESKSKDDIHYLESLKNPQHPKEMFYRTSHFNVWWYDTFGGPLTAVVMLNLANECGANGYKSFIDWLVSGGKIDGMAPHYQYSSTLI